MVAASGKVWRAKDGFVWCCSCIHEGVVATSGDVDEGDVDVEEEDDDGTDDVDDDDGGWWSLDEDEDDDCGGGVGVGKHNRVCGAGLGARLMLLK